MPMVNRLHLILENIIDICFPPSEETRCVRLLTDTDVERLSSFTMVGGVTVLSSFTHPNMRALIHEAKFRGNGRAHTLLAHLITHFLSENPELTTYTWVPIPLSHKRLRARGYNQVEKILTALPSSQPTICTDVLTRIRDTRPQTELDREERLSNMGGAFAVLQPELVRGHDIVLIDDVTTTGATLRAAEAALLPFTPRSITLLALAH